jgi:phage shock protein A
MKDLLDMARDAERWRGRYEGYAQEWAHRASQACLEGNEEAAKRCQENEAVYTREAERERQAAESWAQRLQEQIDAMHQRSFHTVYQPVEYKEAAE